MHLLVCLNLYNLFTTFIIHSFFQVYSKTQRRADALLKFSAQISQDDPKLITSVIRFKKKEIVHHRVDLKRSLLMHLLKIKTHLFINKLKK